MHCYNLAFVLLVHKIDTLKHFAVTAIQTFHGTFRDFDSRLFKPLKSGTPQKLAFRMFSEVDEFYIKSHN